MLRQCQKKRVSETGYVLAKVATCFGDAYWRLAFDWTQYTSVPLSEQKVCAGCKALTFVICCERLTTGSLMEQGSRQQQRHIPYRQNDPNTLPVDTDARVRWVVEWLLLCDLSKPISVDELARSVHISTSRLRHIFRAETGTTLCRFIKLRRLDRARELLRISFLEVKEIANAVGFGDVSHFVRDYKSIYGETPSDTRWRLRSKAG